MMLNRMVDRSTRFLAFLLPLILLVPAVHADCSDGEITATFLVSGIYEGASIQIDVVDVVPLGPVTNPNEAEMIAAVDAVQPGYTYAFVGSAGPFRLFWAPPGDFGACALVDDRDGRVVFAGTVIWAGTGAVTLPAADSHPWSSPTVVPAPAPVAIAHVPSPYWYDGYGTPEEFTDAALAAMRDTDVLASFGTCDDYTATSFIYTPQVGMLYPDVAVCVVMVSGRCGPPWNGQPVAIDSSTFTQVRALFH